MQDIGQKELLIGGAAGFSLLTVGFATWLGIFRSVPISRKLFPGGQFYYINYKGHVKNLGPVFEKLYGMVQKVEKEIDMKFIYHFAGIYYDDPDNLVDPEQFRATIGIITHFYHDKVDAAIKRNDYQATTLSPSLSLYGSFPRKCGLSHIIGPNKYYPACMKYMA